MSLLSINCLKTLATCDVILFPGNVRIYESESSGNWRAGILDIGDNNDVVSFLIFDVVTFFGVVTRNTTVELMIGSS